MKIFGLISKRAAIGALFYSAILASNRASTNVVVWDTMSRGEKPRTAWKVVPSNLMELESDPLKAASDPGYYGRDYTFTGDVVVENSVLSAAFSSATGHLKITAKPDRLIGDVVPVKGAAISQYELVRNAADEVVVSAVYANNEKAEFIFGKNEIVEIKPSRNLQGIRFVSSLDYAVAPAFVGDDLVYSASEASGDSVAVPTDSMLVGLLSGEDAEIVLTWPRGKQHVRLSAGPEKEGARAFTTVDIDGDGQSVFLAPRTAPGIWHREKLNADFLEKDLALAWKPPFSAKWQTQLTEGSVKTTFAFRRGKGTVWRGVPGSYNYPVWFEGDQANFSLSKKVPPRGEAVIYFLEGNDTPADVLTPVDVLKATLGRPMAESIVDVEGRKLRTHHGASGSGVHRACTCGYTEAIQAVFEKGQECDQKQFVDQSIRDMIYFVQRHLQRIDEYRAFATNLTEYLQATAKSNPELKEYLDDLEQTVQQIPAEYENQKENMKSLAYAAELEEKTMALTGKKDPGNLKQYMELLKMWRGMGGAQDYVVAQYHMIARRLFQDAGYNVASNSNPKAVEVAQQIRGRIKQVLRNPDGYEIWANY